VIRITPDEVHLSDTDNYEIINCVGTKYAKSTQFYDGFTIGYSTFSCGPIDIHRIRRGMLEPFFSRRNVMNLEYIVQERAQKLSNLIKARFAKCEAVDLHHTFRSISVDVITEYAFGSCYNLMDKEDLGAEFFAMVSGIGPCMVSTPFFGATGSYMQHLGRTFKIDLDLLPMRYQLTLTPRLVGIPTMASSRKDRRCPPSRPRQTHQRSSETNDESSRGTLHPSLSYPFPIPASINLTNQTQHCRVQVRAVKANMDSGKKLDKPSIFPALLAPPEGIPAPSVEEIKDEALSVLAAAADTTGNAMTVAAYNVVNNPEIYRRLREELIAAFPNGEDELDYATLEKLPYLVCVNPHHLLGIYLPFLQTGVVKEGLR